MEVIRSTKGNVTGEVSVHLVANENTVQNAHLPATAFIIPANATAVNLPTSTLEIQRFPRETPKNMGVERQREGAGVEPITATVIPQISGVQTCNTIRVLEWKDGVATLPGSNLRVSGAPFLTVLQESRLIQRSIPTVVVVCLFVINMVVLMFLSPSFFLDLDAPEPHKLPTADSLCHCSTCGRRNVSGSPQEGRGFCILSFTCRSVIVENSAGNTNSTEILKPVKKRKRKDYQSPSDEEEGESEQMETHASGGEQPVNNTGNEEWNACQLVSCEEKTDGWTWAAYLEEQKAIAAPLNLFQNVCGYRMRLHFDGYSECHDFWLNADSPNIHPAGWFEKTGHKLQPPKGYKEEEFNWANYLRITKAQAAPKHLFVTPDSVSGFQVGMKLEAVDRMNPSLICVATVTDVVDNRFLVHFDNWDDTYDYWCDPSSPYIHPVGWCQEHGKPLTPPQDYPDPENFSWEKYLKETGASAVPTWSFKVRQPHGFLINMRLEAVDRRTPSLIRAASVEDVEDYRIKIHFDGWSHIYDFWIDSDHPDIHPVGWCSKTGHPLQAPLSEYRNCV
uniref:L3MBTL histone methyl-lysine binding protein 1 n=1 Tax=Salvator merianae TaxID=96440 RepID=A0A8D0B120_SALMN